MPVINKIIKLFDKKRLQQIDQFAMRPFEIQEAQLKNLLSTAGKTEWGKQFNYCTINSIEEYQKRVPLQKYEEFCDIINRVRTGEQNILWPGTIKMFAKSSGTTNDRSKFIPVSLESLKRCHYRGGKDVVLLYNRSYPENKLLSGKTLTLAGSCKEDQYNKNFISGDLSAIMINNLPIWADLIRTPKAQIALIQKWEEKLDKLSKSAIRENVTAIAGVPSWNLVMLKYILEFTGKKNLLEIWPNLELFMHGGINFSPYIEIFKQLIPSKEMHYMETYNASEGFFAIQDNLSDPGLLLMLDYGIFYEFIPLDQYNQGNFKAYHIGEVQKDINYAMVISTSGGLWRYSVGDTIMFTSLYPHKIAITGRTKHFINAFGEELIVDNAEKSLLVACQSTGAIIHEYTAAPVYMDKNSKGYHEWLIEFEKDPDDFEKFKLVLDKTLISLNSDYEAKRYNNITLDVPVIKKLRKGAFYKWFSEKDKLGGQNKMPRLSNDRKYADELLKLNESI